MKKLSAFFAVLVIALFTVSCSLFPTSDTDLIKFLNSANETAIKACVKISVKHSRYTLDQNKVLVNGSGVIYSYQNGKYYALTNNHVIADLNGYSNRENNLYDCYGNEYTFTVHKASVSDDLALISFSKNREVQLNVLEFATTAPAKGDFIAAIGAPAGQFNSVSIGKVTDTKTVKLTDGTTTSNVTYPVMCHSAVIDHGSSGGMVINKRLQIVGINFAGARDEDTDEFIESYAIPLLNVLLFIDG